METDIISLIIAGISIISLIYSAIGLKKTGVTLFLLQIQSPISIIKRLLKLGGGRQEFLVGRTSLSADTIFEKLVARGFQWDYFAYNDDGEQVSMRGCTIIDRSTSERLRMARFECMMNSIMSLSL